LALLALGQESKLGRQPWRLSPDAQIDFAACRAMRLFDPRRPAPALAVLREPRFWSQTSYDRRFSHLLLEPVLMGLAGDTAGMRSRCRDLMTRYPYQTGRSLWHEAAWLAGEITDEQFLAQPLQYYARERLALFTAIRDDVRGALRRCHCRLRDITHIHPVEPAVHQQPHAAPSHGAHDLSEVRRLEVQRAEDPGGVQDHGVEPGLHGFAHQALALGLGAVVRRVCRARHERPGLVHGCRARPVDECMD